MGTKYNPNIVRDGLVYYIDAANTRSYSGSGNTAYGLIGGIGGTLVNGVGFSSVNAGYFSLDGTNDYIDFGTVPANTTGTSTVACWVKTTSSTTGLPLAFDSYGGIYINRFTTGKILAFFDGSTGDNTSADVSIRSVNDGNWHYLSATTNGSTCSMYIDGALDKTYSETPSFGTSIYNSIGGQADGFNFINCFVSLAHIYNRALSAQEILQNYNATKKRYL
jgi:hypothetical protein